MSKDELCLKCGRCCYAKLIIGDQVIYTPFPCKYLDLSTHLCTIYEKRHKINPECLTVEEGIRLGVFPLDCPYVKDIADYKPPILHLSEDDLLRLSVDFALLKGSSACLSGCA